MTQYFNGLRNWRHAMMALAAGLAFGCMVHGGPAYAQPDPAVCAMLGVVGRTIAEERDMGIPQELLQARVEEGAERDTDASAVQAFRALVRLIYNHPDIEPGFVAGSLASVCMASE